VEPTFDGEEVIAELRCQKIKLRWWYDAQNPPVTYTLWLAPERNYLCIRWHSLSDLGSREAVGQASQVDEMRELAPGVWLPARVTYTQYDYESLRQVEPVVSRHETFAVEKVFLNPGRPVEFFRNVEIPDDIPVYTIENRRLAGRTFSDVAAPESSAARLVEIIAELKTNERLYENMAVELDRKYRHFRFSPGGRPTRSRRAGAGFGGGKFHAATRSLEKSVLQGGKSWFFEAKETDFDDGTTSRQETTVVGDGDSIQIVERDLDPEPYKGEPKLKTRVQQGRPGHDRAHRPHLLLERDIDVTHSLSELFASKWEGEFHQGNVDVDALGEDECDGNPCDVVRVVDHLKDGKGRYSVHLFWLAKSRNFLPIRAEYYALTLDQHLPLRLATATELREIARGVWFPGKASAVAFERMGADDLSTGRLVILFRNDYRIDKVTLNPNVPPERFAKINVRDDE
jgi:hypothetical protein